MRRILLLILLFFPIAFLNAGTIDSTDKNAKILLDGFGKINFGATNGSVTVTDTALTGHAWSSEVGWINLSPTNGGVSNTTAGILSGYAWGDSSGWINFKPTNGGVTIDSNGYFNGYAWSENLGWISFNCSDEGVCGSDDYKVRTDWRPTSQCNDGIDNDGNSLIDYPNDPGCSSVSDTDESTSGGGGDGDGEGDVTADPISVTPDPEPTPELTPELTPEPSPEPDSDSEGEGDSGDGESGSSDGGSGAAGGSGGGGGGGGGFVGRNLERTIERVSDVTEPVVTAVKRVFEDPVGEATTKTISTVGAATGVLSLATTAFANPFTIGELVTVPIRIWSLMLAFLGLRKKYRPWGVVYDSVTKQPLDPAYVVLKDPDGNEVSTSITDLDGRYGFLVNPGNYKITASKTNYIFPSKKLSNQYSDELYNNLYFGDGLDIGQDDAVISKNIPMDPENFDWNEFAKRDKKLTRFYSNFDIWFFRFTEFMYFAGFFLALIALFVAPAPYNTIIFGIYILIAVLRIVGLRPKKNGHVVEEENGNPLSFAIVRVFARGVEQEITKRITDAYGRYFALVPPGEEYLVTVEKKEEDGSYSHIFTSKPIKAKNGIISSNFKV